MSVATTSDADRLRRRRRELDSIE